MIAKHEHKNLGVGVGLRREYYGPLLGRIGKAPHADWLEVNTENYMGWADGHGDRPLQILAQLRETYPVALHGLGMSLASAEPTDYRYLAEVKELANVLEPATVSDHLCWSGVDGLQLHDLLPFPFTKEALDHVVRRIDAAQEYLGRQILVENISSYVTFQCSEMSEWAFIREVVSRSGCLLLLDVNNVYVSGRNQGEDPHMLLDQVPHAAVRQIHLAGHKQVEGLLIDTHGEFVCDDVWDLYRGYVEAHGPVSTSIEWDSNLPTWPVMARELEKVGGILGAACAEHSLEDALRDPRRGAKCA